MRWAAAYVQARRYEDAEHVLNKLVRFYPNASRCKSSRALVRRRLGDHDGAFDDADDAIVAAPQAALGNVLRANALVALSRVPEALANFTYAEKLDPAFLARATSRGRFAVMVGQIIPVGSPSSPHALQTSFHAVHNAGEVGAAGHFDVIAQRCPDGGVCSAE